MKSFEDVDKHVSSLPPLPTIDPKNAAAQLCVYYKAVKPILEMVINFPFFPASWKNVVSGFTSVLNVMCP